MIRCIALAILGGALAVIATPNPLAASHAELVPAFPNTQPKGPQAAKGAVIWSHGKGFASDNAKGPNPEFLSLLRDDGWDVYRHNRVDEIEDYKDPRADTTRDTPLKAAALSESIDKLEAMGYRRVALAGQSYGAWLSLLIAGKRGDIHAVIANAPAAYGNVKLDPRRYQYNATYLYDFLDDVRSGRIMIAYFRDDPYAPERRGPRSEEILARRDVSHLIIDEPEQPAGHGGGNGRVFAHRFGACVLAVLDAPEVPKREACERDVKIEARPSGNVSLPADFKPMSAGGEGAGALDAFLGQWWGIYSNEREVMLAIERVERGEIHAVYAFGPLGSSAAGTSKRIGHVVGGILLFDEPGKSRLEYRPASNGALSAKWSRNGTTLTAEMRRLAP